MKRRSTWILVVGTCLVLTLAVSGCSLLRSAVIRGITGEARRSVEQEVAPESEPASPKAMTPGPQWNQLMVMQAQMAFQLPLFRRRPVGSPAGIQPRRVHEV